jgi:hypothetical protein
MSIPELAEQLGHSPQMTLMTYTHVIRELKGEPRLSAEKQIERGRREARGLQGCWERVGPALPRQNACISPDSSAWIRTRDLTIMSTAPLGKSRVRRAMSG